jgi:predicted transcriptional regulator
MARKIRKQNRATTTLLTDDDDRKFREIARRREVSTSWLVRYAIREFLKREEAEQVSR